MHLEKEASEENIIISMARSEETFYLNLEEKH